MFKIDFSTPKQNKFTFAENSFSASRITFSENASLKINTSVARQSLSLSKSNHKPRSSLCLNENTMMEILSQPIEDPLFEDDDASERKTPDPEEYSTPKQQHVNPVMQRIMRDLNSPSANARSRAIRALKSPNFKKAAYEVFDLPFEEQDLITEEERNAKSPEKPKSLKELFKDVCIYIEVRTGEDNRTTGLKKVLSEMGIRVNEKLYRDTTHLIFKDGLQSTYNKAKKMNIPIVSILWVDACKKQLRIVDPVKFPISNKDRYENPELYKKIRRPKSMQPEIEFDLPTTPRSKKKNKPPTKKKTPNTQGKKNESGSDLDLSGGSTKENANCNKTPQISFKTPLVINTPSSNRRRTLLPSSAIQSMVIEEENENRKSMEVDQSLTAGRSKRYTLYTPNSMEETNIEREAPENLKTYRRRTLFTPQPMEETRNQSKDPEITPVQSIRRRSLATPQLAPQSAKTPGVFQFGGNSTPAPNQSILEHYESSVPFSSQNKINRISGRRSLLDISMDIIDHRINQINKKHEAQVSKSPALLEMDSNFREKPIDLYFKQQLIKSSEKGQKFQKITQSQEKSRLVPMKAIHSMSGTEVVDLTKENSNTSDATNTNADNTNTNKDLSTQQKKTTIRKRKLFSNLDDSLQVEEIQEKVKQMEKNDKRKSISCLNLDGTKNAAKKMKIDQENSKSAGNRRRTMDFQNLRMQKERKMIEDYKNRKLNPVSAKPVIAKRQPVVLVCTSMHRDQIQKAKQILENLGNGKIEEKVTDETTHLITTENRRTMNVLRGIIHGVFIVKFEWLLECEKAGEWINENSFGIRDLSESAQAVRQDKQTFGKRYSYDLFFPLQPFYLHEKFIKSAKIEYLREIILSSKGRIATRPIGARFILTDSPSKIDANGIPIPEFNLNKEKIVYVRPEWIFDCVHKNSIQNYRKYSVKDPELGTQTTN